MNIFSRICFNCIWLLPIALISCKQDKLPLFTGDSSVYFYNPLYSYGKNLDYDISDSANIYLGYKAIDSILVLPVKLLGTVVATDRPYAMTVITDSSTAKENTDYTIRANKVIAAGRFTDTVFIHIKNRQLWAEAPTLSLLLHLTPNDHFQMKAENVRGGMYNASVWMPYRFKINLVYNIKEPYYWEENKDYLGNYSLEKLRLMITQQSIEIRLLIPKGVVYNNMKVRQDASDFKQYLEREAASGNIIREADGSPMEMGPRA